MDWHPHLPGNATASRSDRDVDWRGRHRSSRIWDFEKGKLLNSQRLFDEGALFAFDSNGDYLAAGADNLLVILELSKHKESLHLRLKNSQISSVSFSKDQENILVADKSGRVHTVNRSRKKVTRYLNLKDWLSGCSQMPISPNGSMVAAGDDSGEIRVWIVESGMVLFKAKTEFGVRFLRFGEQRKHLIVGTSWEILRQQTEILSIKLP